MTYKTLLTALLITTTSYSQDALKTERAKTPSLFTKTYGKVTRTVQRLVNYFHKYVWTSWSKKSLFLLVLCACITANGMSSRVLFPWHMVKNKKKLSTSVPPSSIQSLHGIRVVPVQSTSKPIISANKNSHLCGTQSTIAPIDSPRSVASEERGIPHSNSKAMAQVALGAAAAFASGCALEALRTRLQSQAPQPASPALQAAGSHSEEVVYGPLYPTDIALILSLPQDVRQLLISFVKGPFKLFHEQHRSPQPEIVEKYFHDSSSYVYTHTEEALAFIDNEHIKFLTYKEDDCPTRVCGCPFDPGKPTKTRCLFAQIYIGPDRPEEGLTSKTVTLCESYLPLDYAPTEKRFPKPVCTPEEHRVSIYKPPSHEKYLKSLYAPYVPRPTSEGKHYRYESTIGDVSHFGDGIRRVLPNNKLALWFVPFKTFLAIYEEITPRTPRHHIIDEENYPHPPEIPLIIHSRCHKPHQLIQLIKAAHDIEALTVPLVQGGTYQKRHKIIPWQKRDPEPEPEPEPVRCVYYDRHGKRHEHEYLIPRVKRDRDPERYSYYDRHGKRHEKIPWNENPYHDRYDLRRRSSPPPVIPAIPSTTSSIDFIAFNFDRNTQGDSALFGHIGSLNLTGEEIKKERYITYPPHSGPDRKSVVAYAQPEDIECVIFKRRAHPTDYEIAELFQQVVPPPPAPEPAGLQKIHNVFMPPPQQERLEIKFLINNR